jgi:hypothetical protein
MDTCIVCVTLQNGNKKRLKGYSYESGQHSNRVLTQIELIGFA